MTELLAVDNVVIHRILTEDLEMKHVCSVWVPAVLTEKNKKDRVACCKRILKSANQSVSGIYCVQDEIWVNWDIIKSKQQNKTWIKKDGKRRKAVPEATPTKRIEKRTRQAAGTLQSCDS